MKTAISPNCRRQVAARYGVGLVLLLLLSACGGPELGPQEQVREWVNAAELAAEAKERRTLLELISPAYQDARSYDRDDINDMLRVYFLRQHKLKLLTTIDEIRIFGESAAEVDLSLGLAGANDGVLGFSANAYDFQLELELDENEWLLISARWGELGGDLH